MKKIFAMALLFFFAASACKKSSDEVIVQIPAQYPSTPSYLLPANYASNLTQQVNCSWALCTDPQGDAVYYDVLVSSTPDMHGIVTSEYNLTQPFCTLNIGYTNTFYWQVTAHDNHNNISIGPIWMFSIGSKK
jgi:hypothetical protein